MPIRTRRVTAAVDAAAAKPYAGLLEVSLRSPLFARPYRLVDATTGARIAVRPQGDRLTFTACQGHRYVATAQVGFAIEAPAMLEADQSGTGPGDAVGPAHRWPLT